MAKIERFEDIEAWKEARTIVNRVYDLCRNDSFRKDYNLTNQIQRAAISIMANIAEGFNRRGNKEFAQFLFISKASAAELQSHLYIAIDQKYINQEDFDSLYSSIDKIQRMLSNFIKYLRSLHNSTNPTTPTTQITQ